MGSHRLQLTSLAAAALLASSLPGLVLAADARTLDSGGRTLTVGNWVNVTTADGSQRIADTRRLGWDLRSGSTVLLSGTVPGTFDWYVESTPVLSRNPVTGEILLAWSRQNQAGFRDLVTMPFVDGAWLPSRMTVAARGALNSQVDPVLLHDASGHAYLAWRDAGWQARVVVNVFDVSGDLVSERVLSDGVEAPGPPTLGLDGRGKAIAAFFGTDAATGERQLYVASTPGESGGLVHVPNPIVELASGTAIPLQGAQGTPAAVGAAFPTLHLSVLAGTPVAWWTRVDAGAPVLEHLVQDADGSWGAGTVSSIPLDDTEDPVREALALLETRLLRPSAPPPGSVEDTVSREGSVRNSSSRR